MATNPTHQPKLLNPATPCWGNNMGQAKNRGTFEERRQEAIIRESSFAWRATRLLEDRKKRQEERRKRDIEIRLMIAELDFTDRMQVQGYRFWLWATTPIRWFWFWVRYALLAFDWK